MHVNKYFGNKKELKNKLTEIAIKGNFEFRTRKSNGSLLVIECVDPNYSWQIRASKIASDSVYFVICKYVGIHGCLLLNRKANHRQATYVVVGEQVDQQYVDCEKGSASKGVLTIICINFKAQISYYKV